MKLMNGAVLYSHSIGDNCLLSDFRTNTRGPTRLVDHTIWLRVSRPIVTLLPGRHVASEIYLTFVIKKS